MISILRFLFSKIQFTSDITSKVWIVFEKTIGGYILRKPNIRRKIKGFDQSHSAEKRKRKDPMEFLNMHSGANQQKSGGGAL